MKASHLALLGVAAIAVFALARRGAFASLAPVTAPTPPPTPTKAPTRTIGLSDFDPTSSSAKFGPVIVKGAEAAASWVVGLFAGGADSSGGAGSAYDESLGLYNF